MRMVQKYCLDYFLKNKLAGVLFWKALVKKYNDGEASHYDKNTSLNSLKRENLSLDLIPTKPLCA